MMPFTVCRDFELMFLKAQCACLIGCACLTDLYEHDDDGVDNDDDYDDEEEEAEDEAKLILVKDDD